MSALPQKHWTVEEYLAFERDHEQKHEYLDGEVFLMTDFNERHVLIAGNILTTLGIQLRNRPPIVLGSRMRVGINTSETRCYLYPDASVVSEKSKLEDKYKDTLLNPTVIIEVLSPSTESYDRGKKFLKYQEIASLQEYVLISQDSTIIELYIRQPDDKWLYSSANSLDASIELTSIGCTLTLAEVYDKVDLPT